MKPQRPSTRRGFSASRPAWRRLRTTRRWSPVSAGLDRPAAPLDRPSLRPSCPTAGHRGVELDSGGETRSSDSADLWATGHVRPVAWREAESELRVSSAASW